MTFKMGHELAKVVSPIDILFPDGSRCEYSNGREMTEAVFGKRYVIKQIEAVNNKIEVIVAEAGIPKVDFDGEEFFFE